MIRLAALCLVVLAVPQVIEGSDYNNYKRPITYAGPIVYSDEKPPIISFPGPPADNGYNKGSSYGGGGGSYGYGDSKGPNSITYVPLPLDDLPILIYQSKDKPPIHVMNRPTKDSHAQGGYSGGGGSSGYGSGSTSGYGSYGSSSYAPPSSSYGAPPPSPKPVYVPKPSSPSAVYLPSAKPQYTGSSYNMGGYGGASYASGSSYGGGMNYNNVGGSYGSPGSSYASQGSSYGSQGSSYGNQGGSYGSSYGSGSQGGSYGSGSQGGSYGSGSQGSSYGSSSTSSTYAPAEPPPPPHIVYSGHPPIHVYQQPSVYNQPSYSNSQPSYSNNQPSYSNSQPNSYSNSQPSYSNSQPSYANSQPSYSSNQQSYSGGGGYGGGYGGKPSGYGGKPMAQGYGGKPSYPPHKQTYVPAPVGYHKPPIIIYQGVRPPVHVYSEPSSSASYGASSTGSYGSSSASDYEVPASGYGGYSAKHGNEWEPLKPQEGKSNNAKVFSEKIDQDVEEEITTETEKELTAEPEVQDQ